MIGQLKTGRGTQEKNMNRIERMGLAKRHGTVQHNGRKYWLTQDAYVDNYGTDGGVRYYASAVDRKGREYKIAWDTSAAWDALSEGVNLIQKINDGSREYADQTEDQKRLDEIIKKYGDPETYSFDESEACDWDNPVEVVAL